MTDKSFGDHTKRNVVKNPLLSSAVTGLSFEDLSHIAVLLPVSQAQEVITRPDPTELQNASLIDPNNATHYPSGDTNANFHPSHPPSNLTPSPLDNTQKTDKQNEKKSTDDFDVNEYFARLQGTRYVSAPLNSLKEDANANLQTTEENLEEINLNDDKPDPEVQQSFTSDIAQNFSQLPTVLPQVASAVFSSFSNMLSMKSREQTPDVAPVNQAKIPGGYHDVPFETPGEMMAKENVPMMEVNPMKEVKEMVPPPKEPPVVGASGTTNYRLPTKKKYAQIPGLSTGDRTQIPSYNPFPIGQSNVPPYFVPTSGNTQDMQREDQQVVQETQNLQANLNMGTQNQQSSSTPQTIGSHLPHVQTDIDQSKVFDATYGRATQSTEPNFNIGTQNTQNLQPNPCMVTSQTLINQTSYDIFNLTSTATQEVKKDVPAATSNDPTDRRPEHSTQQVFPPTQENTVTIMQGTMTSSGVIPPPPMFSNARRDSQSSQSSVGILPPSVARRIAGNHPVMKHQALSTPFTQNIFVPALVTDAGYNPEDTGNAGIQAETTNFQQPPSVFTSNEPSSTGAQQSASMFTPASIPALDSKQVKDIAPPKNFSSGIMSMLPPPPTSFQAPRTPEKSGIEIHSMLQPPPKSIPVGAIQKSESIAPPPMFSASSFQSASPNPGPMPSSVSPGVIRSTYELRDSIAPSPIFTPPNVPTAPRPPFAEHTPLTSEFSAMNQGVKSNLPPPPTFFNPSTSLIASSTIKSTADESNANIGNLPPPPVFFNPNTMGTPEASTTGQYTQNVPLAPSQFQLSISETPKVITQPPKDVANLSYRMTKKKPQYYSGPIVGVGAISNNIKPIIPSLETSASPSSLFVPSPVQQPEKVENMPLPNISQYTVPIAPTVPIDQAAAPFDVNRTAGNIGSFASNQAQDNIPKQQDYNTAFDVSRSSMDVYKNEPQEKAESAGFGIIGSLKSKLSALDINKIQSSVTTFFDPTYNDVKKEATDNYSSTRNMPSFQHYARSQENQDTNFEIFVPNVEQPQSFGQVSEQQAYPTIPMQTQESQQNYQTQYLYSHYPNQGQNYPPFSYYSEERYVAPINVPLFNQCRTSTTNENQHIPENITNLSSAATEYDKIKRETFSVSSSTSHTLDNVEKPSENTTTKTIDKDIVTTDETTRKLFETVPSEIKGNDSQLTFNIGTAEQSTKYNFECGPNFYEASPKKSDDCQIQSNISQETKPDIQETIEEDPQMSSNFKNYEQFIQLDKVSGFLFESEPTHDCIAPQVSNLCQENSQTPFFASISESSITDIDSPSAASAPKTLIEDMVSKVLDESDDKSQQAPVYGWKEHAQYSSENQENTDRIFGANSRPTDEFQQHCVNLDSKNLEVSKDVSVKEVSATPLCGLSTMLANKSKELADLEQNMENLATQGTSTNINTIFNRCSNISFFEIDSKKSKVLDDSQENTDLNICETCREVNVTDAETTDLTKQLIENITSPIQLSNPVEVPLPGSDTLIVRPYFDRNQLEEISHITEATIETIQVQSATELLQDKLLNTEISWCADKSVVDKVIELDSVAQDPLKSIGLLSASSVFLDSSILTMPKNASDELKAEYKDQEESSVILPRQMSIPSAPPIEDEDNEPDETIDVHSIEQDASKDFPVEESIIEPSETDDDKIEFRERENSNPCETLEELESFATRVENYKQLDQIVKHVVDEKSPMFGLAATSPSLPIASYFDTGNYAAETHYKNLNSPPSFGFDVSSPQIRIPPGFEEQYQRKLSSLSNTGILGQTRNDPISDQPEVSTQTRPIHSPTFYTVQSKPENSSTAFTIVSKKTDFAEDTSPACIKTENYPVFYLFGMKKDDDIAPRQTLFSSSNVSLTDNIKPIQNPKTIGYHETVKPPLIANIIGAEKQHIPHRLETFSSFTQQSFTQQKKTAEDEFKPTVVPDIFSEPKVSNDGDELELFSTYKQRASKDVKVAQANQEVRTETVQNLAKLPDPMNFFSTTEPMAQSNVEDNSFNRLASYFTSPPKTAPSKPFFELSQSQDHYRHPILNTESSRNPMETNTLIKTEDLARQTNFSQNQNKLDENYFSNNPYNIPQSQYIANLDLIKDLTRPQNLEIDPEQTVKTVNYLSVEYDSQGPNLVLPVRETNIGEPKHNKKAPDTKKHVNNLKNCNADDHTINTLIYKCKFCCDIKKGYVKTYLNIDHESVNFSDSKNFKVKQCMEEKSGSEKDKPDTNMDMKPDKSQVVTLSIDETRMGDDSKGTIFSVENRVNTEYSPVKHHWFYRVDVEEKSIWRGFSVTDSHALEDAFHSPELTEETRVATDGGRFDVNIVGRLRIPVYWKAKPTNVRRCSWFYKGTTDARYVPYTESVAELLEEEYRHGLTTGEWHRRLVLPSNELVVMHGPAVMVHFQQQDARDSFNAAPSFSLYELTFGKRLYRNIDSLNIRVMKDQPEKVDHLVFLVHGAGEYKTHKERIQSAMRPRVVRRGTDESEIEDFEPSNIDHLLLLCHGVGSACDMRFRSVEEVVDDFRATSLQLLQSHYKNSYDSGVVGRVEVLPISWHETLHSGETGVDRRLAWITLDSIPRLRNFTNDTVLDVLFYTSPVFCQTILETVCSEMNRIYQLFRSRNPDFTGGVSLGGHSLGSVILYDLLCHQSDMMEPPCSQPTKQFVPGVVCTGHNVNYPKLDFSPEALYALGSPIAIFECIRGVESLGLQFKLPTCHKFFNIFHPYDPIAYRIEPLVNQQLKNVKPYLIPHHKGRKRMHLELKDTMARVGADLKQKLVESIKNTWANVWRTQPTPIQLEKVVEEEIEREQLRESRDEQLQNDDEQPTPEQLGRLNAGRRIDYVLQEAPFEMINEYLFAMSSHVCYWESEDTMLLMLREIYDAMGVQPDCTVPAPSLTVQRTRTVVDEMLVTNMSDRPSTSRDAQPRLDSK